MICWVHALTQKTGRNSLKGYTTLLDQLYYFLLCLQTLLGMTNDEDKYLFIFIIKLLLKIMFLLIYNLNLCNLAFQYKEHINKRIVMVKSLLFHSIYNDVNYSSIFSKFKRPIIIRLLNLLSKNMFFFFTCFFKASIGNNLYR